MEVVLRWYQVANMTYAMPHHKEPCINMQSAARCGTERLTKGLHSFASGVSVSIQEPDRIPGISFCLSRNALPFEA